VQKYGNIDADDIYIKLDVIKQKPRRRCKNIMRGWIKNSTMTNPRCKTTSKDPSQVEAINSNIE
jgi:hypothetical protein